MVYFTSGKIHLETFILYRSNLILKALFEEGYTQFADGKKLIFRDIN